MKLAKNALLVAGMLFTSASALAGGTQIGSGSILTKCDVQMSDMVVQEMGLTAMSVEVLNLDGKLAGKVNNVIYNRDIQVKTESVGDLSKISLEDSAIDQLNDAERRIIHLKDLSAQGLASAPSFDLNQVRGARLYDLDGNSETNKFGGVVLMEVLDANGQVLGRIFSSMLPGECK